MAIRNSVPFLYGIDRKIDQAYEMASLARMDGDKKDADRWMKEVERLKELKYA